MRGDDLRLNLKLDFKEAVFGGEKECYAHKNRAEYWAEGVQCWFDTNRTMDHDHNHINTRGQLKAYDPALAQLCKKVMRDSPWRFSSPQERAGDHEPLGVQPEIIAMRKLPAEEGFEVLGRLERARAMN